MSARAKTKPKKAKASAVPASICWFEIPADNMERAGAFYSGLFGWKIKPMPGMADYWHIDTGGDDASPDGGMMKKLMPEHSITAYVMVPSITKAAAKVGKLGGKVCKGPLAVPHMGHFAICQDTENNVFALWQRDEKAK
jgi:predicted enzyme related to lactoylglutathione lyase